MTRRYSFTDFRPVTKDTPLLESGLLGPVRLETVTTGAAPTRVSQESK